MTTNVQAIASLHQRALAESDGGLSAQQLERLVAETQTLNGGIRDQLKFLATDASRTTDGSKSLKDQQVSTQKANFERELRAYQQEESQYRQRYRDQIARQYRIVNPDASESEVRQATEADWGNEGVFQTAVCTGLVYFAKYSNANIASFSCAPTAPDRLPPSWATFVPVTTSSSASSRP